MDPEAMKPQGLAILDYYNGNTSATVVMHGDDEESMDVPTSIFFREPADWSVLERTAVELCRGRVLDVGAGAGCHSLVLQERGLSVCAIDLSPEAVQVMKKRGLREVHHADVFHFKAEPFDTILMMMNGVGIVETLSGLDRFVKSIPRLLKLDGQILLDSFDAEYDIKTDNSELSKERFRSEPYFGEVELRLEYRGRMGPSFRWLYVDPRTLKEHAKKTGWDCEVVRYEQDGAYLAQVCHKNM